MLKLILIFLTLAFSPVLSAEEKRTHSGKIIVGDSSEYTYSNSSEANRQSLRFGLGMSGAFNHARYSAFYYVNPDLALEIFARSIRDSIDKTWDDWDRREKSFGVSASYFTKDAWFFRLGLLHRQAKFDADRYSYDAASDRWSNSYDVRVTQKDIAAEASIGTQWQWNSFYFGFDWLSYERRLVKLSSSTSLIVKDSDRTRMNYAEASLEEGRLADNSLNQENYSINVRLGWSF